MEQTHIDLKNYFFIIGLPRSRTSWLANFFTIENAFCYHEATRFCHELSDLKSLMDKNKSKYVGNSDPALLFLINEVMDLFPNCKIVIIDRDFHDCIDSYLGFFSNKSYLTIITWMEKTYTQLERVKNYYEFYTVNHDDLDNVDTCRRLWEYLLPDMEFDRARWQLLDEFYINKHIEKYKCHVLEDGLYRKFIKG